ncbi:MFS transporter [Actinomadura rupiterrae]|uniref:MFS transporter n=1 Tax=Actinomadura rupiterrae TaxID=559627 RepID=UPI003556C655|nr:DHA2 family methylenomycin A resistance protein-like MFS transporter [Actinomadura rupiterrae]
MSLSTEMSRPAAAAPARRRTLLPFAGIAAGNFMIALDATILNVALPDMRADLHAPAAALPWAVDAYTVVLAGLMLASGSVADRWGPRAVYRVALAGFALFSLLCALAPNVGVLIAGRALLGVPAAGLVPASMALLAALFPEPDQRSRRIGSIVAITGIGVVGGPVLGGALVALGGWRLVFLVNIPVGLLTLAASRGLSGHRGGTAKPIDRTGILLSTAGLVALTFSLVDGGTGGWLRVRPLAGLLVAAVIIAALPLAQRRAASPVLPPALVRLTRVRVDLVVGVMSQFIYYGLLFALTQWMVDGKGLSPLQAGAAFLPMTVPVLFVPVLTGRFVVRFGARRVMLAGLALDLAGGIVLALGGTSLWTVFAVQVLVGVGSPLAIPSCIADMSAALPLHLAATGQGALNAARQTGTALGVAVFGTLAALSSAGVVLLVGAVLTLTVLVAAGRSRRALGEQVAA